MRIQGAPAPGISSGQALVAMDEVAAHSLPSGYRGLWTDVSFQEKRAEGKTAIILAFAVLFELMSPGYFKPMLESPLAPVLLGAGFGMEAIGFFMVWRIAKIKV